MSFSVREFFPASAPTASQLPDDSHLPIILIPNLLQGQAKTSSINSDTMPACFPSVKFSQFYQHTLQDQITIILTFNVSNQLKSTPPPPELAKRAFAVGAPVVWNSLPAHLRHCQTVLIKRHLKTHYFNG